uniref:Uncharacterized protein n=1 Tax=Otus sunia TaxID=257818 RepID=A0A8C8E634_9STRI
MAAVPAPASPGHREKTPGYFCVHLTSRFLCFIEPALFWLRFRIVQLLMRCQAACGERGCHALIVQRLVERTRRSWGCTALAQLLEQSRGCSVSHKFPCAGKTEF